MEQFDVSLYLDQLNMEVKLEEKQRELEAKMPKKYIGSGEDAFVPMSTEEPQ